MNRKEKKLTAAWLRENMSYDAKTGGFAWTKPGFGRTVGKSIGSKLWSKGASYLAMKINGEVYYAHRVAWLHHYGEWPNGFVDHKDENRTNNAIDNLRIATPSQNAARRPTKRSLAPSRGVFPHGPGYVARIHFGNKRHYLGYFTKAEDAQAAYEAKAKELHGEFAHSDGAQERPRGDYLNTPTCEMCGKEGQWGADNIRRDTTTFGQQRGALCLYCWGLIQLCNADKKDLNRIYRQALHYIDRLDVFDDPADLRTASKLAAHLAAKAPPLMEPPDNG